MSQQELLSRVSAVLSALGVEYMLTGSLASSFQGEPRSTHDIDLVVVLTEQDISALLRAFPEPDYFLSEDAVREAIRHRSMFNLLSLNDGEKVDFWLLTNDPFDLSRFRRKTIEEIQGIPLAVSSPEDTILVKLRWAEMSGGSEKQMNDALRVYELQRPVLDLNYLNEWSLRLGVESLWQRLQADAASPDA